MSHFLASQHCLYHIFRYDGRFRDYEVAERAGLSVSTLRKYIAGQMACPVEVLKMLYTVTRHPMLKELLEPEGHELVPRDHTTLSTHFLNTVDAHVVEALGKIVDLQRAFERALEDRRIDPGEYQNLRVMKGETIDALHFLWGKIVTKVEPESADNHARSGKVRVVG